MKNMKTLIVIIFLFITIPVLAQYRPVQFGARPPINLDAVSSEHMEPGRFRIKVTRESGRHFDIHTPQSLSGYVTTGMKTLDQLAEQYTVYDMQPVFSGPALLARYSERHRKWGLHLWYDLSMDPKHDVADVVRLFQRLDEVDVAEPVFHKQLVGGEIFDWHEEAFIRNDDLDEWTPDDPQFGAQWHYHNTGQSNGTPGADISLQQAWAIEKGSPDIIVAIVDDGIQFNHPDLQANMWEDIGFNFVDNNSNVVPGDHGTHVAGTVAAVSNNGVGVAGVAGGSGAGDGVRLMSAQVFRGNTSGGFALAPVWAADNGAAISQNSWGYTAPGVFEQAVLDAIDYFNVNGGGDVMEGGITIFAAGNSGSSGDLYPGYYEGAMSVAATNHNDQRSSYSTFGPWVDISAPGGETTGNNSGGVLSTVTGSGYAFYQGTSMACPHVSGVAALILSYAPDTLLLTNVDLYEILVTTADDHYDVNPNFIGQLGSGRLNALRALQEVDNYAMGLINPSSFSAMAVGTEEVELSWNLNASQDPVLLAFSDHGTFGTPEGSYEPGDQIEGGGTVLAAGQSTQFIHEYLEEATTYYYKIWSIKEGAYSSGRITSGTTWCGIFDLPFAEDFSSEETPHCWETPTGSSGWQFGSFSGGLNIDNAYAYTGTALGGTQNATLTSPIIDMSNFEDVNVSFDHYFRTTFLGGSEASFEYSLDGGASWTSVNSWSNTTANPANFETMIPELAGQSMVQFRWTFSIGFVGYYWTVGNIIIDGTLLEIPQIHVDPESLLVEADAGETAESNITISNQGTTLLELLNIQVDYQEEVEFLTATADDETIEPGESTSLHLHFDSEGLEPGEHLATLTIVSNDPNNPELPIPLTFLVREVTPETIVEIVEASEDHQILATALDASGLDVFLSGPGPFTLFAPTDVAFNNLPDGLLDDLLDDPTGDLANILLYHAIEASALSGDLSDGQTITTILGDEVIVTINDDGVFINDAQVTVADLEAENGVVHVIDAVLTPPTNTVVDIINSSESHTILAAAIDAAGLDEVLGGDGPFTVFAPVDNAFDNLPDGLLDDLLDDPAGELTDILLYHVVEAHALSNSLSNGQRITTLLGNDIFVTINEEGVFINDAQVVLADLEGDNGVVHVIDAVLSPDFDTSIEIIDLSVTPDIQLYPNPASSNVTLEFTLNQAQNAQLEIVSLTGETVFFKDLGFLAEGGHLVMQNIAGINPGLYLVVLSTDSDRMVKRLQVTAR